jgi:hypothetical protein
VIAVRTGPAGALNSTLAPGTTAPVSSVTWPRKDAVWATAAEESRKIVQMTFSINRIL